MSKKVDTTKGKPMADGDGNGNKQQTWVLVFLAALGIGGGGTATFRQLTAEDVSVQIAKEAPWVAVGGVVQLRLDQHEEAIKTVQSDITSIKETVDDIADAVIKE